MKKIAFLGPNATFTHEASLKYFGENNEFIPINRISEIYNKIMSDEVDFGVVPSENSIGGSISDTLDLFIKTHLKVYDEVILQIKQNLLSKLTDKSQIKKIFSHPQSLMQCSGYISANFKGVECIETSSNAKASILAKDEPDSAAIGPKLCAKEYDLNIIEEGINDSKKNETKFYIISKTYGNKKNKSLIIFSVPNKSGSLFNILKVFKKYKINMTKIESRPSKTKNWEYVFIVEYENSKEQKNNEVFIKKLKGECDYFDYLGHY
ncbi:MAG: hypothetical protein A2Y34_07950 [Spirochaetes bacterium GWC1_27_15]|nr:MAG: hypothetical protein A2Z98_10255 [Spirochaetes bacterium GWB1_27_13]OHD26557.1 MAG: hypothetical protein A2Y34_07950 [Spirochaetes bacterium GWC1_27_15]